MLKVLTFELQGAKVFKKKYNFGMILEIFTNLIQNLLNILFLLLSVKICDTPREICDTSLFFLEVKVVFEILIPL